MDSTSAVRKLRKLSVRNYGPLRIVGLVELTAVGLELPRSILIHPVIHVEHSKPARIQPVSNGEAILSSGLLFIAEYGKLVIEVDRTLPHWCRGCGFQFSTLHKDAPSHEAEWKPRRDLTDAHGSFTQALRIYTTAKDILFTLQ